MRVLLILLTTTTFLIPNLSLGQKAKFSRKSAEKNFRKAHFEEALENFLNIDSTTWDDRDIYSIGVCYYNLPNDREKATPYFERYLSKTDTLTVAYYFLANLYHESYRLDTAIATYEKFKDELKIDVKNDLLPRGIYRQLLNEVEKNIEHCNFGKSMMLHPRKVVIENLGDSVNTDHDEYAPVISENEQELYFTSRREGTTGGELSPDGDYFEDIYHTTLLEGSLFNDDVFDKVENERGFFSLITPRKYTQSTNVGAPINTNQHDASVLLSADEKKLYIYRNSELWVAEKDGNQFAEPVKIEDEVNAGTYQPTIVFSYDGNIKFVSSERDGGKGGLDIYYSTKNEDGTWSRLKNLGSNINTPYDDDVNYYDQSTKILYFSSKGHSGMGGYDIFKSEFKNDKWQSPMNMGYPVNTPFDDVFYIMTKRYNRGYYSSERTEGRGGLDLYRLTFSDERSSLAEIKGLVLKNKTYEPAHSKITLLNKEEVISKHQSDASTGDYLLLLGHGIQYSMLVETEGFVPYKCTFTVPDQVEYYQLYQEVHHVYIYDNDGNVIGQQVTLNNAFFDLDEEEAKDDTLTVLFNETDTNYMAYLEELKKNENYEQLSNVNFYLSEDSLRTLIQNSNPKLELDFPDNTRFAFLRDSVDEVSDDPDDYKEGTFTNIVYSDTNLIVVQEFGDKDSLFHEIEEKSIEEMPKIVLHFDFNSAKLKESDELKFFLEYLKNNPDVKIEIIGHTDNWGTQAVNLKVGRMRASNVKRYFSKNGISTDRMKSTSQGESSPIAHNTKENGEDDPEGRAMNRRVEFVFSKQE